jgi:hypothetical protein
MAFDSDGRVRRAEIVSAMGGPPDGVRLFVLLFFGLIFSVSGFLSPSLARFHSGADATPKGNPGWPPLIRSPFREGRQTKPSDSKSQINTMKTDKNSQTTTTSGTLPQPEQTVPDSNQGTATTPQPEANGAMNHLQNLPPDDEADFGPLHTYVLVPRGMFCFFVLLSMLEGTVLFWIFRQMWHAVPPGAR